MTKSTILLNYCMIDTPTYNKIDTAVIDLNKQLFCIDKELNHPYLYDGGVIKIYLPDKYKHVKSKEELILTLDLEGLLK